MPIVEDHITELLKSLRMANANEAETRLKVIDRVMFEVLNWRLEDVAVEHRVSEDGHTQITDYFFKTATSLLVVEAKRIGKDFSNVAGKRRFLLSDINLTGDFGSAVKQARDFCRSRSVLFAVVTNGDAWFIFPANRNDGVLFSESSGIFFESIEQALLFERDTFVGLLSRDAVIERSLDRALLGTVENQVEQRRLNLFFESSTPKLDRHNIFDLVESEFVVALNPDISTQDVNLLREAYVRTPSRIKFDRRIQMHIRRRENVASKGPIRPMKSGEAGAVVDLIKGAASRVRPLAIMLLGPVGAGKTTFLEYTYGISAASVFEKRPDRAYPHWVRLDFRGFSAAQNVRTFIFEKLFRAIEIEPFMSDYERCVKHAYKLELDALFRGPLHLFQNDEAERNRQIAAYLMEQYKKVEPYVLAVLRYTASKTAFFLVIDNVDQIEDAEIQETIFSEVMAIAHESKFNIILAMRDATYVKNKNSPIFDAYDFDPVAIESPPVESVLSRRFAIAENLVAGNVGEFVAENGMKIQVSDLRAVVEMLRRSVLGTEIGRQIEILATGDVRLALRMTREFLQYGYSATAKAYRIFRDTGNYQLPPHEALRAIMLGNQTIYREAFSVLGNPFDARLNRTEFQLARLFILSALVAHASDAQFQFVTGNEILESSSKIGLPVQSTLRVLSDLHDFRFVQTLSHGPPTPDANYIPTRLGGHIIRQFLGNFTFLENVMMDTFIPFDDVWEQIRYDSEAILRERHNTVARLRRRKQRVLTFYGAMQRLYQPLLVESRLRALPAVWCTDPLANALTDLHLHIQRATRSAVRLYGDEKQSSGV